jgi:hypothetical protein
MDKVQKTIGSQCYIPSSQPFRIHSLIRLFICEISSSEIFDNVGCNVRDRIPKSDVSTYATGSYM